MHIIWKVPFLQAYIYWVGTPGSFSVVIIIIIIIQSLSHQY